jgi:hypothetical protein
MFTYALGTVEEGDPHIGDQESLPMTEASVSELMNAIREGFGLGESQNMAEGSAHGYNVVKWYEKWNDQKKLVKWLRKEAGLPNDDDIYFDDADLVYGDKTIVRDALVDPNLKFIDLLNAVAQATGGRSKQKIQGIYREQGVAEGVPQPGPSSGAPKQFGSDAKIQTRQMTVKDIISSVPDVPYYNNVVDDWDAKDYSWGVTKKVIEYATYLKDHPESLAKLPPAIVLNGKFEDGAHRVSAIWLLQQRMDPKNPLWKNAKLNVQFVKQGVAEDGSNAMSDTAKRLANKDDGKVAKLRAAGDKRREEELKSRNIAKKDKSSKDQWGNFKEEVVRREEFEEARMSAAAKLGKAWDQQQAKSAASRERAKELLNPKKQDDKEKEVKANEEKQRLDPKCWKGYRKQGTKMKGGVRVNNCVKIGEGWENIMTETVNKLFRGK